MTMNQKELTALQQDVTNRLAEEIASGNSGALLSYLKSAQKLTQYSPFNQMLITCQEPSASNVMPKNEWQKAGHEIKTDAKPLFIYAPCIAREKQEEVTEPTKKQKVMFYRVVTVYDITQTTRDGKEVPPEMPLVYPNLDDALTFHTLIRKCPHHVRWTDTPEPEVQDQEIWLPRNSRSTGQDTFLLLWGWACHHIATHHPKMVDLKKRKAEGVVAATILSETIGLEAVKTGAELIHLVWGGKPKPLSGSMKHILETVAAIGQQMK